MLLRAIDPNSPDVDDYFFEWRKDNVDLVISNKNELVVSDAGKYSLTYFFIDSDGNRACENFLNTEVKLAEDFELEINGVIFCEGNEVRIRPSEQNSGAWFIKREGEDKIFLGNRESLELNTSELQGFGEYTIFFEVSNPSNPTCSLEKSVQFTFNPSALVSIEFVKKVSDCTASDGSLLIRALTDIDWMYYVIDAENEQFSPGFSLLEGEEKILEGLSSGVYIFEAIRAGCINAFSSVVPLENTPPSLVFSVDPDLIVPERCTTNGKSIGSFTVSFQIPPDDLRFELYSPRGVLVNSGEFDSESQLDFVVEVSGGTYFLEIFSLIEDSDDESCKVPNTVEIEVLGLPQVEFSVPEIINFCSNYELKPNFDTNQNLEFSLINLDDDSVEELVGASFLIEKEGRYALTGRSLDFPDDICPRRIEIVATSVEPVIFEELFVSQDCQGNQIWEVELQNYAPNQVNVRWFDPSGQLVSTGLSMRPVTFGDYKVEVQPINILGACPDSFSSFFVSEPVLSVDVALNSTPLCPSLPDASISLISDFDNIGRIVWRFFGNEGQIEELVSFENEPVIIGSKAGIYEVAVFNSLNTACEIGRTSIEVNQSSDLTDFDVPMSLLTICEFYDWTPTTDFELEFLLIFPDGNEEVKMKGDSFRLNQAGEYLLRGIPVGPSNEPFCPIEKSFEVALVSPINFSPEFIDRDCDGFFTYSANIGQVDASLATFYWRNSAGEIVGSNQIFQTNIPGIYTLEVQPLGSIPCDVVLQSFEVEEPVLSLAIELEADPFCPEANFTLIRINEVDSELYQVSWVFISPFNNIVPLNEFEGEIEIAVNQEGTYEVTILDDIGCVLASDQVLLLRSSDPIRPTIKERYQICREYEIGELINPGNFLAYSWILGEQIQSSSSVFKPQLPGEWSLIVTSLEGCDYQVDFLVEEECELKVTLPNAMILNDPARDFRIYTNYLVDEIEVYIFNKWGQQVFHCKNSDAVNSITACEWDGSYGGEKLVPGAYAVRIIYRNVGESITKNLNTTLTVFQ
ncbi:gliding motility-associated C-terminal domain-containing protein [Mongoliitalea lutea]|uniref:gliding motility-associated C-terminal domain-containing protein n=1 Tax=Mongoliitalea lutea TaxID=849756 RepID=UPI001674FBCE|nr:gliding motility-associated C-terminal domain-containing protein [Mongoliitalea lutea]